MSDIMKKAFSEALAKRGDKAMKIHLIVDDSSSPKEAGDAVKDNDDIKKDGIDLAPEVEDKPTDKLAEGSGLKKGTQLHTGLKEGSPEEEAGEDKKTEDLENIMGKYSAPPKGREPNGLDEMAHAGMMAAHKGMMDKKKK